MDTYELMREYHRRFGAFPASLLNCSSDRDIISTLRTCLREGHPAE